MSRHVALLGDSVFDNASYTAGEAEVAAHLRAALGPTWRVTLVAVDGTTTTDIGEQLDRVRDDVTHLALSVGGNDALLNAGLLDTPVRSTGEALDLFDAALSLFETNYRNVVGALQTLGRPLVVCTIYNGNLPDFQASRARVALRMFNDVIVRAALAAGVDALELRDICTTPEDFANPIEPSGLGGKKIASAIAAVLDDTHLRRSTLRGAPS
jgi:hypothetical protein